jgi:hypothetical protein
VSLAFPADIPGLADALVFWFLVGAWVIVLGSILFVQLPRAFREARRIVTRLSRLINDPPLTKELAQAEVDVLRLGSAQEALAPLQRRAERANSTIRTTPLIPPAIGETLRRIRAEYRAFRRALR